MARFIRAPKALLFSLLQQTELSLPFPCSPTMASATKMLSAIAKATNNNLVINVCLVGSFIALSFRSMKQQQRIDALEDEKDSLINSNKAIKKTMWNWKQQLFAEASSDSVSLPLATLKAIYGESPTPPPPTGVSMAEGSKSLVI